MPFLLVFFVSTDLQVRLSVRSGRVTAKVFGLTSIKSSSYFVVFALSDLSDNFQVKPTLFIAMTLATIDRTVSDRLFHVLAADL